MEPISLIALAASYAGAAVAQKVAEKSVQDGSNFMKTYLGNYFGRVPEPENHNSRIMQAAGADQDVEVLEEAQRIVDATPALRRAEFVAPILRHAQILWVDDNPENNIYEREVLRTLGSNTDVATSTEQGMVALQSKVYDLVVSDMSRGGTASEGLVLLQEMRKKRYPQRVVFYVGTIDPEKGKPAESFGITDRPDELLHLIMDILERQRV